MGQQVTLTFAGEEKPLTDSFGRVGQAAKNMESDVRSSAAGFDRVGEAADDVDTKAMGFRDTLTGVQDSFKGLKAIGQGDIGFESLLTLGAGVGDLGSGLYNFVIPSLKSFSLAAIGAKIQAAALATWSGIVRVATLTWTGVQWLLNAALTANPIGLVIVAIGLLVGVIIWIATKTTWFQDLWKWVWSKIGDPVKAAWDWIKRTASSLWDWLTGLPGKLGSAFKKIGDFVTSPFKWAFNQVAKLWNSTIGQLSWTVPSWVPLIGGNTISVPHLPTFHAGGVVPGAPGQTVLAMLQAGETVTSAAGRSGNSTAVLEVAGEREIVAFLRRLIKQYRLVEV